ncbi:MAG TPA: YdcF family protein [Alphaproteobacteria bacterium]|nr:YdcF family protein [Alphaproteobacteria bacterium]
MRLPEGPLKRRLAIAAAIVLLCALSWTGGLAWFASRIPSSVADPETVTDAIVVLTGGSARLDEGLALLAAKKAQKLFVSGVYRGVEVTALLHVARRAPANLECCIVLGHAADSTFGNAGETAEWMAAESYHSLRLVTAAYHMPRSLLEFHHAMPDIAIVPHPVFPTRVKEDWWAWPGTAGLILGEYHKYLFALLRDSLAGPSDAGGVRVAG